MPVIYTKIQITMQKRMIEYNYQLGLSMHHHMQNYNDSSFYGFNHSLYCSFLLLCKNLVIVMQRFMVYQKQYKYCNENY